MTTKFGLGNCTCKQHVQETVTIQTNQREGTIERKCHGRKFLLHSENNLNMNAIWPRGTRTHALAGTHNYGAAASVSGNPRDTKAQLQLKRPTQIKNDKDKDNGRQTQRRKDKGRGRGQGSAHRMAKHFEPWESLLKRSSIFMQQETGSIAQQSVVAVSTVLFLFHGHPSATPFLAPEIFHWGCINHALCGGWESNAQFAVLLPRWVLNKFYAFLNDFWYSC